MRKMMVNMRGVLSSASLAGFVLLVTPALHADLIGSAGITWFFPDTSTVFASDTIAVGSTLACPGASPICTGYGFGTEDFTVGLTAISYTADAVNDDYTTVSFNGFDFTGLTFADGGSLTGVSLLDNTIPGLTASDVSFTAHSVEVNLEGLPVTGTFELSLMEGRSAVPEPTYIPLMAAGLASLAFLRRRLQRR